MRSASSARALFDTPASCCLLLLCVHPACCCREGKFNVLPEEPDVQAGSSSAASAALPLLGASASAAAAAAAANKPAIGTEGTYSPWVQQLDQQQQPGGTYSAAELAGLRAQLEALLERADDAAADDGAEGGDGSASC